MNLFQIVQNQIARELTESFRDESKTWNLVVHSDADNLQVLSQKNVHLGGDENTVFWANDEFGISLGGNQIILRISKPQYGDANCYDALKYAFDSCVKKCETKINKQKNLKNKI